MRKSPALPPHGTNHPVGNDTTPVQPLARNEKRGQRTADVTDFAPNSTAVMPRLMSLHQAATYTSLSYWTVRDLVLTGQLPAIRVPLMRVNDGARRGENRKLPAVRVLVGPSDPRVSGQAMRRTLVDRLDLDRLIDAWKADSPTAARGSTR